MKFNVWNSIWKGSTWFPQDAIEHYVFGLNFVEVSLVFLLFFPNENIRRHKRLEDPFFCLTKYRIKTKIDPSSYIRRDEAKTEESRRRWAALQDLWWREGSDLLHNHRHSIGPLSRSFFLSSFASCRPLLLCCNRHRRRRMISLPLFSLYIALDIEGSIVD